MPITQLHLFVTMLITEVMVVSDPNYTIRIGNENYFSLAVAGFIGIVFLVAMISGKFSHSFRLKSSKPKTVKKIPLSRGTVKIVKTVTH